MAMKSKCVIFCTILILIVFTLWLLVFKSLWVGVLNKHAEDICVSNIKLGNVTHHKNILLNRNQDIVFFDFLSFSNKLLISYYPGVCTENSNPVNLSCTLEKNGSDYCLIYIQSDKSLDCSECYK